MEAAAGAMSVVAASLGASVINQNIAGATAASTIVPPVDINVVRDEVPTGGNTATQNQEHEQEQQKLKSK